VENAVVAAANVSDGSRTVSRRNAKQTTLQNLSDIGRAAERTAATGWRDLSNAVGTASHRTHDIADGARSRLTEFGRDARLRSKEARKRGQDARKRGLAARDEAYRRGAAARDALSGRRSHTWRWVVTAATAGLAAGAAVAGFGRRLIHYREQAQLEKIEQTVADATADMPAKARVNSDAPSADGYATSNMARSADKATASGKVSAGNKATASGTASAGEKAGAGGKARDGDKSTIVPRAEAD